ncbi:bifunctional folylpolyglutamate synthase/dihydrofolate synthase [Arcobacter sp. FWKO B]|uniref:bifunctional folylpolyglutamate synthase/dihydrofolate synthase n=1 Tax=Arcobacter sp. FWKO B TaxID=2593672 RepID=UPI0018A64C3F|nr:Mur ligase family protein [Arcobacter sp. FWKO B]QOG12109.1 bifunctional folylpolyglutamate synthase/dihydrofolate synthase [Arcobacter sp. FWKO B]
MIKDKTLEEFLEHKTLYYDKIDYNTIQDAWDIVEQYTKPKYVIHIVGTNGKGSTGRILATYLHKSNFKVFHYTSPHIIKFNERIWINGKDITDDELENGHKKLLSVLTHKLLEKLTYFEYTTLLALLLSDGCDYLVLEAGLGGEFDATNVIKNDLSLITTIDYDHQEFLGNTIEEITSTKVRSADTTMIVAPQVHQEVYNTAKNIASLKKIKYYTTDDFILARKSHTIFEAEFLNTNLKTVLAALEYLEITIDFELFKDIKIKGRCEKLTPLITIDVGHNPLAAKMLAKEFKNKKINLVYNTLKDKDYKQILGILKPVINHLYIIPINDKRSLDIALLEQYFDENEINYSNFSDIPENKELLVFGSFKVVEEFLHIFNKGNNEE